MQIHNDPAPITILKSDEGNPPSRGLFGQALRLSAGFLFIVLIIFLSAFIGARAQQRFAILGPDNPTVAPVSLIQFTPTAAGKNNLPTATLPATTNHDTNPSPSVVLPTPTTGITTGSDTLPQNDEKLFKEAWQLTYDKYVDQTALDDHKMTYSAITGMLSALGDSGHTRFLSPSDIAKEDSFLSGSFSGIGAQMTDKDGIPSILSPIEGAPAQKAGLKTGDEILDVNGKSTDGESLDTIIDQIRGPKGTQVTLTILHRGETQTHDITITRDEIVVPSVEWKMLPPPAGSNITKSVGYIKFNDFGQNADTEMTAALTDLLANHPAALIVDVRDNPGGYLNQATRITSHFLPEGNKILLEQDRSGQQKPYPVEVVTPKVTDLPIVVITNKGTVSSAEIFTGALQDNKRATIIGTDTFGTGTVLSRYPLSDGSAIDLGIAEWLTPNGRFIRDGGIKPDKNIVMPPNADVLLPGDVVTLYAGGFAGLNAKDPQLGEALHELLGVN